MDLTRPWNALTSSAAQYISDKFVKERVSKPKKKGTENIFLWYQEFESDLYKRPDWLVSSGSPHCGQDNFMSAPLPLLVTNIRFVHWLSGPNTDCRFVASVHKGSLFFFQLASSQFSSFCWCWWGGGGGMGILSHSSSSPSPHSVHNNLRDVRFVHSRFTTRGYTGVGVLRNYSRTNLP